MAGRAVPVDRALDDHAAAHDVERRDLDHGVVTALRHDRVGRRGEMTDAAVVVQRVDGHFSPRAQDPVEFLEDTVTVGVVVVTERIEPAHHGVERSVDRERTQVALQVRDRVGRQGSADRRWRQSEVGRGEVDARDVHARHGQASRDPTMATRRIEDAQTTGRSSRPRISEVSASECTSLIESS